MEAARRVVLFECLASGSRRTPLPGLITVTT